MTKPDNDSGEKASALLALGITREQAEFKLPSDEELAQLVDPAQSESLDAVRKAQIMDAIANDPATFSRWMNAVEMAETLELGPFAEQMQDASEKSTVQGSTPSLLSRVRNFFSDNVKGLVAFGGAAGMAMALVFMLPVGLDSRVSRLYDDYGSHWDSLPEKLDVVRSGKGRQAPPLSPHDQLLKEGLEAGLDRLGEEFSVRNINPSNVDTSAVEEDVRDSLWSLGKVVAISHFKCSLGAQPDYFSTSLTLIETLLPPLERSGDPTSAAVLKSLQRAGSAETRVCRLSKLVISRVSS